MKKTILYTSLFIFAFLLVASISVYAENLPASDSKLIKEAGIPIYSEATFINGSKDVGYRFATKKSPDDVRTWYTAQLPTWSVYQEYGGWILYDGKPGIDLGTLMSKHQVSVQTNEQLHDWFGLDKAMSTEIVIMFPMY